MFVDAKRNDLEFENVTPAPKEFTGFFESVGLGANMESLEIDAWNRKGREVSDVYEEIWSSVRSVLGEEKARSAFDGMRTRRGRYDFTNSGRARERLFSLVAEASKYDPNPFKTLPDSHGKVEEVALERMRAEYADASEALTHGGSGVGAFLGRMGVAATDQTSLAFMMAGGPTTSIPRLMMREALLGGASEAAVLPRMYEMAEELDIPDPNPVAQIALGATGAAALAGVASAAFRAATYAKARLRAPEAPPGLPREIAAEAAVEAEEVLTGMGGSLEYEGPPNLFDTRPVGPRDPEPEEVVPEPIDLEAEYERALAQMEKDFPETRGKVGPLSKKIKKMGVKTYRINGDGEREITELASELRARGITNKTHPYLFKKDGLESLDAIDPESISDGFRQLAKMEENGNYLDPRALLEDLVSELTTGRKVALSPEMQEAMDGVSAIQRAMQGETEFTPGLDSPRPVAAENWYIPAPDDPLVDFDPMTIMDRAQIIEDAMRGLEERSGIELTPLERQYIGDKLNAEGGDVRDALHDAAVRFMDESDGEIDANSGRGQGDVPESQASGRGSESTAAGARTGAVSDETTGSAGRASEPTPEGEQFLVDGVKPISQADRLREHQNRLMRGGDAPLDEGLFGDPAMRAELFDDLTTQKSTDLADAAEAEIRAEVDGDTDFLDLEVEIDGETVSAREMLDDIEKDKGLLDTIESCGLTGRTRGGE